MIWGGWGGKSEGHVSAHVSDVDGVAIIMRSNQAGGGGFAPADESEQLPETAAGVSGYIPHCDRNEAQERQRNRSRVVWVQL